MSVSSYLASRFVLIRILLSGSLRSAGTSLSVAPLLLLIRLLIDELPI
jgi:hypothetical protein